MDLPDIVFETPLWLALVTVGVAALEGSVIGCRSRVPRYDVVGVFTLALVVGLTGGIVRDLLIGNLPVMAIRTPWFILTVIGVAAFVVAAGRHVPSLDGMWFAVLDALTLGLYTAIATGYAMDAGVSPVGAIFVGVAAGVAGGIAVALLRGVTPPMLVPGIFYSVIALLGAIAYVAISPMSPDLAAFGCVGIVVVLRVIAVHGRLGTRALPLLGEGRASGG